MLLILTLMYSQPLIQVLLQILSTMYVITYIAANQPYVSRSSNVIEILNELTVLIAAYPLLTFTDWVQSA